MRPHTYFLKKLLYQTRLSVVRAADLICQPFGEKSGYGDLSRERAC